MRESLQSLGQVLVDVWNSDFLLPVRLPENSIKKMFSFAVVATSQEKNILFLVVRHCCKSVSEVHSNVQHHVCPGLFNVRLAFKTMFPGQVCQDGIGLGYFDVT